MLDDGKVDLMRSRCVLNDLSGTAEVVVQAGAIAGGVHVHAERPSLPVPRQLPLGTRGFTDRVDQLAVLDSLLSTGSDRELAIAAITGTAGVGKTALAVHWAHRVGGEFPDGQLYVDLRGYGPERLIDPSEALAGFLRALGVGGVDIPEEVSERSAMYRSLLSDRRVLVVLDNARTEDQVRPLLPGSSSCLVVVTSRRILSGLVVHHGAEVVPVDLLSAADAVSMLHRLLGSRVVEGEPDAAVQLVHQCARLPLALRIAAELARSRRGQPLEVLASKIVDEQTRLDVLEIGDDPRTAVRTVFSWSYRQLPGEVARAFRLLAAHPCRDLDIYAVGALIDEMPRTATRVMAHLVRAHLVIESSAGRFGMHDLLRAYATELSEREDSAAVRTDAVTRLFDYYLHTAEQADRIITPYRYRVPLDGVARPAPDLADYDKALTWMTIEMPNAVAMCRRTDGVLDTRCWQLAYTLRGYFFVAKQWDAWIETHERALAAARRVADRRAEALTLNNLGLAFLERGRLDLAARHYMAAWRLFEKVGDKHGVCNALANYATVLHYRGDLEEALQANQQALGSYQQVGSRRNAAITLRSIALIEIDLRRFTDAVRHLDEALVIFTELALQVDAAMAMNCLGEAHYSAGDAVQARRAHRGAARLAQGCGSRYERARAHHGLGRVAKRVGDHREAVEQWQRALALYTELGAPAARQLQADLARLISAQEVATAAQG
ncbi:tetratricopeptide repeat protein [Saccharopolyspora sp. K220]|uniref:ATP-binding protein n=1 Tax=Saccharopolyspora soli TaxID=2926618 RepID=UPI001F58C3B6|nr:tetratricopeptide repeat protein [Saccharopolyspora soli]MCI2420111.1 tetratricopeptide repeat protein [Saccharopolyspora soli]